jgi:hypothetical protein
MPLDWLRLWPELIRLNLEKARHSRRLRSRLAGHDAPPPGPSPCQSGSDSGRAHLTRCEACLRFDHARHYRLVCPAIRVREKEAFCSLDSRDIRPAWSRVFIACAIPPLALVAIMIFGSWGFLRFGSGLKTLSLADVAWPPRWENIAEHRRARFRDLALDAIHTGDFNTATVALFAAASTGQGSPGENIALARLATLGKFYGLADDLHARNLAAHPGRAEELALAWHDDLLLSGRPRELARLALAQLPARDASREFWLRAFFESIRHPGVSADLLAADPPLSFPHPGLEHALRARAALDRKDLIAASDGLLALSGLMPGQTARRFLAFSWMDADRPLRAKAAALSTTHPAPPGEIASLAHALLRSDGLEQEARAALRPLFSEPSLRFVVLAALVRDPDADLLREFESTLPPDARSDTRLQVALWIAARRAGAVDIARSAEAALEKLGHPVPGKHPENGTQPAEREALLLTAALLPLDREILHALHAAP